MFERKNFEINPERIVNIFRLGKVNQEGDKIRPLLIKFDTFDYKTLFRSKCHKLKYFNDKNESKTISYSNDLTAKERKERNKLVDELKDRRAKNKQQNITETLAIRNNQVVTIDTPFPEEARRSWASLFK